MKNELWNRNLIVESHRFEKIVFLGDEAENIIRCIIRRVSDGREPLLFQCKMNNDNCSL